MTQIWHIVRKDLRHHWPYVLVALLVSLGAEVWAPLSLYPETTQDTQRWIVLLSLLQPIAWLLVVARLVHDEALLGTTAYWLSRPYDWRCLLAAKGLFLLLALHFPLLLIHLGALARNGFSPWPHLGGLVVNQLALFATLVLVSWAMAALTKQIGHFLLLTLGSIVALTFALENWKIYSPPGLEWSRAALHFGLGSALAGVVLWWQYTRRGTRVAVAIAAVGFVAAILLPRAFTGPRAIALQQWLSPATMAPALAVTLDGPRRPESPHHFKPAEGNVLVWVPLAVAGFGERDILVHQAEVRLVTPKGERIPALHHEIQQVRPGQWWQVIQVSRTHLDRVNSGVQLETKAVLSTFRGMAAETLALGGEARWVEGVGWCASGREPGRVELLVRCRRTFDNPNRLIVEPLLDPAGSVTGAQVVFPGTAPLGPKLHFSPVSREMAWLRDVQQPSALRIRRLAYEYTGSYSWSLEGVPVRELVDAASTR